MSKLMPNFPKHEINYLFKPDDIVYVPVLVSEDLDNVPLYCNLAYSSERQASKHFWFTDPENTESVSIISMTTFEYLKQYDRNGINPFVTIAINEFFVRYSNKYNIK